MTNQLPLEDTTVNGIPVKELSESGQRLFQKLIRLKQESDDLEKKFGSKQSALKELGDLLVEEVEEIKAARAKGK